MSYCTRQDIVSQIAEKDLVSFLDDSRTGAETPGLLDNIISNTSADIDGRLSGIFAVPFTPAFPPVVKAATVIFVCYALYRRRLTPDENNPFASQYKEYQERLTKIGNNELPLDVSFPRAFVQGAVVTTTCVMAGTSM